MSGAVWVGENVVGSLNAPQCPPGPLKLLDQFFAVRCVYHTHFQCVWYTLTNYFARARCCAGLFISPPATEGPRAGPRAGGGNLWGDGRQDRPLNQIKPHRPAAAFRSGTASSLESHLRAGKS